MPAGVFLFRCTFHHCPNDLSQWKMFFISVYGTKPNHVLLRRSGQLNARNISGSKKKKKNESLSENTTVVTQSTKPTFQSTVYLFI